MMNYLISSILNQKLNNMETYPKKYNKITFTEYLEKINTSTQLLERFERLPAMLIHNNIEYELNVIKTYYAGDGSYFNFELNYYSDDILEFLFTYKIFQDIEDSVNYLECELINENFISHETDCHS